LFYLSSLFSKDAVLRPDLHILTAIGFSNIKDDKKNDTQHNGRQDQKADDGSNDLVPPSPINFFLTERFRVSIVDTFSWGHLASLPGSILLLDFGEFLLFGV
jgi:hypothetical protein